MLSRLLRLLVVTALVSEAAAAAAAAAAATAEAAVGVPPLLFEVDGGGLLSNIGLDLGVSKSAGLAIDDRPLLVTVVVCVVGN